MRLTYKNLVNPVFVPMVEMGPETLNLILSVAKTGQVPNLKYSSLEKYIIDKEDVLSDLKTRLRDCGISQDILDDLEISQRHMASAARHFLSLSDISFTKLNTKVNQRLNLFFSYYWEYVFGLLFLSFLAEGIFFEENYDIQYSYFSWWMQQARNASVQMALLEQELRGLD